MNNESTNNSVFSIRCSLLQAIGEAGASASVLDPEPSPNGREPVYGYYPVRYGLMGMHAGCRGHEVDSSGHSDQGIMPSESDARERASLCEQDACPAIQPKRRQYDHAA